MFDFDLNLDVLNISLVCIELAVVIFNNVIMNLHKLLLI